MGWRNTKNYAVNHENITCVVNFFRIFFLRLNDTYINNIALLFLFFSNFFYHPPPNFSNYEESNLQKAASHIIQHEMVIAAAAPQWYHNSSSWRYIEEKTSEESWDNPEETKRRQTVHEERESEHTAAAATTAICRATRERFRGHDQGNNPSNNPPRQCGTGNKHESKKKERMRIKRERRASLLLAGAKRGHTKMKQTTHPDLGKRIGRLGGSTGNNETTTEKDNNLGGMMRTESSDSNGSPTEMQGSAEIWVHS